MRSYKVKSGIECQEFQDYDSYSDLLREISLWWDWADRNHKAANIDTITFSCDEGLKYNAIVHWAWLTPETERKLNSELTRLVLLKAAEVDCKN